MDGWMYKMDGDGWQVVGQVGRWAGRGRWAGQMGQVNDEPFWLDAHHRRHSLPRVTACAALPLQRLASCGSI